jgi:hypothetical protein
MQNNVRAEFVNLLSKIVVGNSAPILCQLQPTMRAYTAPSWIHAWDLVSSYVASNNLPFTLDSMNTELQETKQALRVTLKSYREANDEFNELLSSTDVAGSDSESVIRRTKPLKSSTSESDVSSSEDQKIHTPTHSSRIGKSGRVPGPAQRKAAREDEPERPQPSRNAAKKI